jgi:hypothetical protein
MFDPIERVFYATDAALPVSPTPPQPKCLRGRINSLFLRTTGTGCVAHNRRIQDRRGAAVIARTAHISITQAGGVETRPRNETRGFTDQIWRDSS